MPKSALDQGARDHFARLEDIGNQSQIVETPSTILIFLAHTKGLHRTTWTPTSSSLRTPDFAKTRVSFLRDQDVVTDHIHRVKWAIRKGKLDYHCDYDALSKAKSTMIHGGGGLATVNCTERELSDTATYESRSAKPVIFIVDVSGEECLRQVRTEEYFITMLLGPTLHLRRSSLKH